MPEVKWTARRVSDDVLVDVTGNTDGTPLPAPQPNALEAGGTAQPVVESIEDPGAIGAGNLWIRLDPTEMFPPMLYVRNAADDGWSDDENAGYLLGLTYYDGANVVSSIYGDSGAGGGLYLQQVGGASLTLSGAATLAAGASTATVNNERNTVTLNPTLTDDGSLRIVHKTALGVDASSITMSDAQVTINDLDVDGSLELGGDSFGRAAFVANGSTVDQLRDALIAAGLMAAS